MVRRKGGAPKEEKLVRGWAPKGRRGRAGALPAEGPATWRMGSIQPSPTSISPDSVVVYTLKYYEVQQRERNGMKCSRSLTVTNITRWQMKTRR